MEKLNNMPEYLLEKLNSEYDENIVKKIIEGFNSKRNVTVRVNNIKATIEEVIEVFKKEQIEYETVVWYENAFIIKNKVESDIEKLDIYNEGKIYMQNLSSMIPPIVLNPEENKDILDMAAAPGGKTTQIAALTNNKAHITACEMNALRAERLKYNLDKQGATCAVVMKKDARQLDDFFSFDNVLLDAPCSGSGTILLEDENTCKYFSKVLVEKSCKAQKALISKALKVLKKGQVMVYSTCSILREENEEIVDFALKNFNVEIVEINFDGKDEIELLPCKYSEAMCVCPTNLYEGFFVVKLRKK